MKFNKTITSGLLFDAVQAAITSGNNYITLALKSDEKTTPAPWWVVYPYDGASDQTAYPSIDLTLNFTSIPQNYQFVNKIEGAETSGMLNVKNNAAGTSSSITSGTVLGLDPMLTYTARTNELPFIANWNSAGNTEKHNYWIDENGRNNNSLTYTFAPQQSGAIPLKLTSNFDRTYSATIQATTSEGITGTIISLKDSRYYYSDAQNNWYQSDEFKNYASPLIIQKNSSGSYGGVFLNQDSNNNPYYSVSFPSISSNQSVNINGVNHNIYFVNWSASPSGSATIVSPNSTSTPVIFKSEGATVTANIKASMLSSTQSAFSNSSQRKFIRTPDGYYHLVYESMGEIWYERSVDGGTTWILGNNGKPLNNDYTYIGTSNEVTGTGAYTVAKHPSLDCRQNTVFVVWQEQSGSNYVVRVAGLENGVLLGRANTIPFTSYGLYSEDVWPQIAIKDNGSAVVAIRRGDAYFKGLEVHYLTLYPVNGGASEETMGQIPGTDQNTGQFTLATDRSLTDKFHIAWQQILGPSSSSMIYTKFNFLWSEGEVNPEEGFYQMNSFPAVNVSSRAGYYQSFSPSIFGVNDGTARLVFKGYKSYYTPTVTSCNPDNLSWIPYLNKGGGEVYSPQISAGTETYFVGWTELTGGVYRTIATDASTLSAMETVNGSLGRDMQINTGGTRKQQFSMSFNSESTTLPYSFTRSEAIETIVGKKLAIKSGRGIFLSQNESQLYFILGNVTLDGVPIGFIKAQDSVRLDGNLKKVNHFMATEPFALKDNSKVTFAVVSGTKDSVSTQSSLKDGQFASFKVELIDEASGRVLGSYVDEKMDKANIFSLKEAVYKLNTEGIGNKFVRLRVSVDENMKSEYTISDMFLGDGILISKSLREKEMNLQGLVEVKEYAISQNYPNPFNPTTIINYQIPKASKVTLKVYDILGKEVATLVNGYMEMGKYSAEFNASGLPSGIYIYEIRAGDFVKSSKMMLLK